MSQEDQLELKFIDNRYCEEYMGSDWSYIAVGNKIVEIVTERTEFPSEKDHLELVHGIIRDVNSIESTKQSLREIIKLVDIYSEGPLSFGVVKKEAESALRKLTEE